MDTYSTLNSQFTGFIASTYGGTMWMELKLLLANSKCTNIINWAGRTLGTIKLIKDKLCFGTKQSYSLIIVKMALKMKVELDFSSLWISNTTFATRTLAVKD